MAAIKREELERLEKKHGLGPDGLTYQLRCSRIAAYEKGEKWENPSKNKKQKDSKKLIQDPRESKLWGKRLLISPMMTPDAKRNLAFDELIGHEIVTEDFNAGETLQNMSESTQRMVGDYKIVSENKNRLVYAKTTFPKIGTEISWDPSKGEIVPVVRGNDGQRGYIWSFPTCVVQVEDELVQLYGLRALIETRWPELIAERKFSGKPMMTYIDGITLAASIPLTNALLKQKARQEKIDVRAGLV